MNPTLCSERRRLLSDMSSIDDLAAALAANLTAQEHLEQERIRLVAEEAQIRASLAEAEAAEEEQERVRKAASRLLKKARPSASA